LTEPETGATLAVRRITVQLRPPTRHGETELHILTTLPVTDAPAALLSALYADRWTIATAVPPLRVELACEVDTLGYPKAALVGFCVALVASNIVALVTGALRAAPGAEDGEEQLSMYYLTVAVAHVATGRESAVGADSGEVFRPLSAAQVTTTLVAMAQRRDTKKYTKHPRGPKKSPPHKLSGKRQTHVSTARILAMRG
jgi:hypothetical protein